MISAVCLAFICVYYFWLFLIAADRDRHTPGLPLQTVFIAFVKVLGIKSSPVSPGSLSQKEAFRVKEKSEKQGPCTVIQLRPQLLNTHAQHVSYVMLNNACIDR